MSRHEHTWKMVGEKPVEYLECDCGARVSATTEVGNDGTEELTIRLAEAGTQVDWDSDELVKLVEAVLDDADA